MRSPTVHLPVRILLLAVACGGGLVAQELERPGDPPAPHPAQPVRNPSPLASTVSRGPFVSVQVNVDAASNNIPGDAANEPTIAIDPTNPSNLVIGWRQFDNVSSNFRQNGVGYSRDGGKSWTFPGPVQPSLFNSDPVLDTDAAGNFYYLSYPGATTVSVFRSGNAGQSWTGPTIAPGGDKAWLAADRTMTIGRGNLYIVWQVASGPNTFTRSTNGGASFSAATAVPQTPTFGTMTIDVTATVFAAGLFGQRYSQFVLARSTNAKDPLQTPAWQTVSVNMGGSMLFGGPPNPGGLLGQAQVAVDPAHPSNIYMLCSVQPTGGGNAVNVNFARSTDGGKTFGAPVRVNDDATSGAYHWFGTMSVAPNGRIDVVWNDTRTSGVATMSETFYAFSLDAGTTWSKSIPFTPQWNSVIGWPNQNKIGDYYGMVSDDAAANLAYSATFNGEQDVWFTRLGDCNKNGVHDSADILTGVSFDSNANTIPDECELCQKDLGFGAGLQLLVCGDDLVLAGSRATLEVEGGPPQSPAVLVFSAGRLAMPLPLPGGGALVPDLGLPGSFAVGGVPTNGKGKLGIPIRGGAKLPTMVYAQAAMLGTSGLLVSNAVEIKIGIP